MRTTKTCQFVSIKWNNLSIYSTNIWQQNKSRSTNVNMHSEKTTRDEFMEVYDKVGTKLEPWKGKLLNEHMFYFG